MCEARELNQKYNAHKKMCFEATKVSSVSAMV